MPCFDATATGKELRAMLPPRDIGKPFALRRVRTCIFAILSLSACVFLLAGCQDSTAASGQSDDQAGAAFESGSVDDATASSSRETADTEGVPTPLVAQYDGIVIHSPIRTQNMTGVLFHQASYDYALVMTTELPEADPTYVYNTKDFGISYDQPTGDSYMAAHALHIWRTDASTAMDTSVDVGAVAGTKVYAPVTGTVVLVKDYLLFDVCPDIEIHIQPEGRPDLDVVVIHAADQAVKAGDRVIGGQTVIAHVRDIAAYISGDIQLADYTANGDPGDHSHVQVNDANYPGYRENKLAGAITAK
jgi:biotin carboxyl carrier protein